MRKWLCGASRRVRQSVVVALAGVVVAGGCGGAQQMDGETVEGVVPTREAPAQAEQTSQTSGTAGRPRPGESISEAIYLPCGPSSSWGSAHHQGFLDWVDGDQSLLFDADGRVLMVDAEGEDITILAGEPYVQAGFHADGQSAGPQVVYSSCEFPRRLAGDIDDRSNYHYELVVLDARTRTRERITNNSDLDHYPVWSPSGDRIAFLSDRDVVHPLLFYRGIHLHTMASDGSDLQSVASMEGIALSPPMWSPDGERLAFLIDEYAEGPPQTFLALYVVGADGTAPQRVAALIDDGRVPFGDVNGELGLAQPASWSPDGERLAFLGLGEQGPGLYVSRHDGSDARLLLPTVPDVSEALYRLEDEDYLDRWEQLAFDHVAWAPDGAEILFAARESGLFTELGRKVRVTIYAIQADGSGLRQLPLPVEFVADNLQAALYGLAWSSDSSRIAVYGQKGDGEVNREYVLTMARDGSDVRLLAQRDANGSLVPAAP